MHIYIMCKLGFLQSTGEEFCRTTDAILAVNMNNDNWRVRLFINNLTEEEQTTNLTVATNL